MKNKSYQRQVNDEIVTSDGKVYCVKTPWEPIEGVKTFFAKETFCSFLNFSKLLFSILNASIFLSVLHRSNCVIFFKGSAKISGIVKT